MKQHEKQEVKASRLTEFLRFTGIVFLGAGLLLLLLSQYARFDTAATFLNTSMVLLPMGGALLYAFWLHGEKLMPYWLWEELAGQSSFRGEEKNSKTPSAAEKKRTRVAGFAFARAIILLFVALSVCFAIWPDVPGDPGDELMMIAFFSTGLLAITIWELVSFRKKG